jgi:hypothetical protein
MIRKTLNFLKKDYFFQINSKNIINYMLAIITNNFGKKPWTIHQGLFWGEKKVVSKKKTILSMTCR